MKNLLTHTPSLPSDILINGRPSLATRCLNLRPSSTTPGLVPVNPPRLMEPAAPVPDKARFSIPEEIYAIRFGQDDGDPISAEIRGRRLYGKYTHSQELLEFVDCSSLTSAMKLAYRTISGQASSCNMSIQPRLVAWQLVDRNGRILARSVPTLVCASGDVFGATTPLSMSIAKDGLGYFTELDPAQLSITPYTLRLHLPGFQGLDSGLRAAAERLEILSTMPLHPVSLKAWARVVTRLTVADSSTGTLTVWMPGTASNRTMTSINQRHLIESALPHFHTMARVIGSIPHPLNSPDSRTITIPVSDPDPDTSQAEFERIIARSPITVPHDLAAMCTPPNSYTATARYESADITIMADITPHRFKGPLPDTYMTRSRQSGTYRQLAKTSFDMTGEALVASGITTGQIPTHVSPLIVSPHPDATSITLRICTPDSVVRSRTFPLTPSPCGRYSYYLASELFNQEITTVDEDYVVPAEVTIDRHQPNALLVTPAQAPYAVSTHCTVGDGTIHRVTRAVGSASSWDFARQHLLAYATDGIYTLSVNSARTSIGATRLHPVGVTRPDAVASTPWAIYAATSEGALIALSGNRVTPVARAGTAAAVGYEPVEHELWVKPMDSCEPIVIPLPAANGYYRRSVPLIDSFAGIGDILSATDTSGQRYNLSATAPSDGPIPVEYTARWSTGLPPGTRLRQVLLTMQSARADMDVALLTDSGTGLTNGYLIVSHCIAGPVNAPIRSPVPLRPLDWLTLRLSATCHPDTLIGLLHIVPRR